MTLLEARAETGKGIFEALYELGREELDWLTEEKAKELDDDYYYRHSARKNISSFYDICIGVDPAAATARSAVAVANHFAANWKKIRDAYLTEYSPLENYDSTETEKISSKVKVTSGGKGSIYGFNSSTSSPANETEATSVTEGSGDDNVRELHRHGNIGVTTSQQMLEAEMKLRRYDFYESVFADVDTVMCSKIY